MKKNKLIELGLALEELRIKDISLNDLVKYSDEQIEIEQNIYNRFENEKQNPYFDDDSNIDYSGLRKLI